MEYNQFSSYLSKQRVYVIHKKQQISDPQKLHIKYFTILCKSNHSSTCPQVTTAACCHYSKYHNVMFKNNRSFPLNKVALIGIFFFFLFFSSKPFQNLNIFFEHFLLVNFVCNSTSQFFIITAILLLMGNHPS